MAITKVELANMLLGVESTKKAAAKIKTSAIVGTAHNDSQDGYVLVDLGGDVISVDGKQYVSLATTADVRAGDKVYVLLRGADGTAMGATVIGSAGGGDRTKSDIAEAAAEAAAAKADASSAISMVNSVKAAADTHESQIDAIQKDIEAYKKSATATYATKTDVDEKTGAITKTIEADYTKTADLASTDAVKDAKSAGTTAQSQLSTYKTSNDAAVADAKSAGTTAQSMVNNLQVGGRNLFVNSARYRENTPFSLTSAKKDNHTSFPGNKCIYTSEKITAGTTVSFQAKSNLPWAKAHLQGEVGCVGFWLYECDEPNSQVYFAPVFIGGDGVSTDFRGSLKIDKDCYLTLRLNTYSDGETEVTGKFWDIKLERGTKITDWTPAPEDVDTTVADAKKAGTDASSALNDYKATVTQTYAEKTELTEAVNQLSSTMTSQYTAFTDYRQTNDTALSKAQSDAMNAQSTIDSYKSSNDKAVADAKAAGTTAQNQLSAYKGTNDQAVADAKKAGTDAQADLDSYKGTTDQRLDELKNIADNAIETFYLKGAPTASNPPASSWTTDALKKQHAGDLYMDTDTGYSYRWSGTEWVQVKDSDVTKALTEIANIKTDYATKTELEQTNTSLSAKVEDSLSTAKTYASGLVSTEVTQRNAAITAKANEITQQVSKTYTKSETFSAYQSDADTRIATANSNASTAKSTAQTAAADAATAKTNASSAVSTANAAKSTAQTASTNASNAVSTANSANSKSDSAVSTANSASSTANAAKSTVDSMKLGGRNLLKGTSMDSKAVTTPTTASTTWGSGFAFPSDDAHHAVIPYGAEYRCSVDVLLPVDGRIVVDMNTYAKAGTGWTGNDNDNTSRRTPTTFNVKANVWTRLSWGSENTSDANTGKQAIYIKDSVGLLPQSAAVTWHYRGLKVELGNKATDWSPAPEDTDSAVADAKKAGTDAQTSANAAKTAASNAQTSANNAQKAADTAKSTADAVNRAAVKTYPYPNSKGVSNWVHLGDWSNTQDSHTLKIDLLSGNGYNAGTSQNSTVEIFVKDGYQSEASTSYAYAATVTLGQLDRSKCHVDVIATSATACSIWVKLDFVYDAGSYTVAMTPGDSWTHSGAVSSTEPTGTKQNVAFLTNAEEANAAAGAAQSSANAAKTAAANAQTSADKAQASADDTAAALAKAAVRIRIDGTPMADGTSQLMAHVYVGNDEVPANAIAKLGTLVWKMDGVADRRGTTTYTAQTGKFVTCRLEA